MDTREEPHSHNDSIIFEDQPLNSNRVVIKKNIRINNANQGRTERELFSIEEKEMKTGNKNNYNFKMDKFMTINTETTIKQANKVGRVYLEKQGNEEKLYLNNTKFKRKFSPSSNANEFIKEEYIIMNTEKDKDVSPNIKKFNALKINKPKEVKVKQPIMNMTNVNININVQQIITKKHTYKEEEEKEDELSRKSNSKLHPRSPSPLHLHSRSATPTHFRSPSQSDNEDKQRKHEEKDTINLIDQSPTRKWKKISNLFRSLKSLTSYETKNLVAEEDLDEEMKDYRERLFDNTKKVREIAVIEGETTPKTKRSLFNSQVIKFIQMHEDNLSKINRNNKEEIYRIIIEGDAHEVKNIDRLFKNDPEYYLRDETNPNFKFNTPLSNGKTLLYIACKEGKADIVEYLLDKKIDPFVKSKVDFKEVESPLQVACRWNYCNIVNLLLEKVDYKKDNIKEVLNMPSLEKTVQKIIKKYYYTKFNMPKKIKCC